MNLKKGDEVWVKLPYGDFVVEPLPGKGIVLVAGGTGITPFVSLLASDAPELGPMSVLYGARRPELLVYSEVLEAARQRWPHFRWHAYVEEEVPAWASSGRLSVAAAVRAAEEIGNIQDSVFYLSGPPEMLKSLKEGITQAGILSDQIRIDAWE
jgi:ferredoxin-NADP reductase